ncbi:MAG TPA: alpha/beta fold hydrolase [Usitatibacteraceae bacterium]|nr:alpha/beta hydrolase [Verrucomicrobiales bacterium]HRE13296.1 alpha/beta fold hydrolase [Usitatibacteraceae bacterium]
MSGAALSRGSIAGEAGAIELAWSVPESPVAVAVVAHPHPLFGGTMDNKVVTTVARAFHEAGAATFRFNFRGVGASEGAHDEGRGETDDFLAVLDHAQAAFGGLPTWFAGFSFGGGVALRASSRTDFAQLVLMAPALRRITGHGLGAAPDPLDPKLGEVGRHTAGNTVIVHGDLDDTVPLADSFAWATPRDVPVLVVPGADHFFHRKLHVIRGAVTRLVRPH